jgi:hypothetical protein
MASLSSVRETRAKGTETKPVMLDSTLPSDHHTKRKHIMASKPKKKKKMKKT